MGIPLVLFNILTVILTLVFAQDDFGSDDAGSEMDMESMLQSPGSEAKSDPNAPKPTVKLKTLVEESVSALQQLGFIIGNKNINQGEDGGLTIKECLYFKKLRGFQ